MATLIHEKEWVDKKNYDEAEKKYFETLAKPSSGSVLPTSPKNKRKNKKDKKHKNLNSTLEKETLEKVPAPTLAESSPAVVIEIVEDTTPKPEQEHTEKQVNKEKPQDNKEKPQENKEKPQENKEKPQENKEKPQENKEKQQDNKEKHQDIVKEKQGKKGKKGKTPPKDVIQVLPLEVVSKPADTTNKPAEITKPVENINKPIEIVNKPVEVTNKPLENINTPVVIKKTTEGGLQPNSLASEVAKARQHIKNSLECMDSVAALAGIPNPELLNKLSTLEKENADLKKVVQDLRNLVIGIQKRVETLESQPASATSSNAKTGLAPAKPAKDDSDDGVDLFASDDEEESAEAAKIREQRLAAYNAKKSKKPVLIAKSNIILDIKPWDDETDMKQMEEEVRKITMEGLLWGAAKLVPLAYGIHKLQISCVVEDDKVSIDELTEELEKLEDYVQSVDIAAFNKV